MTSPDLSQDVRAAIRERAQEVAAKAGTPNEEQLDVLRTAFGVAVSARNHEAA